MHAYNDCIDMPLYQNSQFGTSLQSWILSFDPFLVVEQPKAPALIKAEEGGGGRRQEKLKTGYALSLLLNEAIH